MKAISINRKARFNYFIEEELEAGIILLGSEVKSVRAGRVNISDSYAAEVNGEIVLMNCHISEYKGANRFNHDPMRIRKLLLHKKEIRKLLGKVAQKGYSLIPTELFINNKGLIKLKLGLAKGKKLYDKRESIKERDENRRMAREED